MNKSPQSDQSGGQLPQTSLAPPAFNCHVYLMPLEDGRVLAEVANLPGISLTADSERAALQKVVQAFKAEISRLLAAGQEVPWQEPAPRPEGAQERFLPMHL